MEGLFINKSLYDLRDTIQEILKVKNQGVMDMAPSIIDFHMKDYCPKYKDCFSSQTTIPNTKTIKSILIELIFKKIVGPNLSTELIEQFYKKLQVCVFCVMNISRDPITNNPPPSPYIDINSLKHMFNYYKEEIFYSYRFEKFKYYPKLDINKQMDNSVLSGGAVNTMEIDSNASIKTAIGSFIQEFVAPQEKNEDVNLISSLTHETILDIKNNSKKLNEIYINEMELINYKQKFYEECVKLMNIIDHKYSHSDRSRFIDPIQNSIEYRDFRWLVSKKMEDVIVNGKIIRTSGLLFDFQELDLITFYEKHKIVDFYLTYKNIFISFFDFLDKSNAISTIGTIEYMDQISKFNTVNVLGVLEDSILPEVVGFEEMNINILKKNKIDARLSGY